MLISENHLLSIVKKFLNFPLWDYVYVFLCRRCGNIMSIRRSNLFLAIDLHLPMRGRGCILFSSGLKMFSVSS